MSQINTIWEINGVSLELDLQDVEQSRTYEKAFELMGEDEKNIPKNGSLADVLLAKCNMFRHLYDNLFGEGTSEQIFGKRNHQGEMMEAYESFLNFVAKQSAEILDADNQFASRFNPNRAQRRAKK